MRIALISLFSFVSLSVLSNSAFAQQDSSESDNVHNITFEGVDVNGTHQGPTGKRIVENKRPPFHPLINLREDFTQEMSSSLDGI